MANVQREKVCYFTGHRILSKPKNEIQGVLREVIERLINEGVCYFGNGGALGFDTLAAQTVLDLKEQYPHIKLIMVLPCKDQTKKWNANDVAMYEYVLSQADKITYQAETYYDGCMLDRNRRLVDSSGHCICYYNGKGRGGTAYTIRYATEQGLKIHNIF